MTIIECLKKEVNTRLSIGSKWLIWDFEEWVVLEHKPYKKKTIVLCRTPLEEEAVKHLTGGE